MKTEFLWAQRLRWIAAVIMVEALLAQSASAAAVEVDYRGRVVNEFYEPIAGAKAAVIGAPLTATADASGGFALKGALPAGGQTGPALNPLEFSAEGYFARTLVPDSPEMRHIVVSLDCTGGPVEGRPVDIGRFGYAYRKSAPNNPSETRWLRPYHCSGFDDKLLCGFLWEELCRVERVEVELPPADAAALDWKDLKVISNGKHWWNTRDEETLAAAGGPTVTPRGTTALGFLAATDYMDGKRRVEGRQRDVAKLNVIYGGSHPSIGVPIVHAYAAGKRWGKPQTVEIEWAFDRPGKPFDGSIEAYFGFVGKIEPLESGNGVLPLGEHHWREIAAATGRRGIRATVYTTADRSTNITVSTSGGTVTFAPSDLAKGPILVPSVGVFVAPAGSGVTARQFQEKLDSEKRQTLRQRVREHAEQSWAGAMGTFYHLDQLPTFPVPPQESPMQIDVPEKQLVAQWRLGGRHLARHAKKLNDRTYGITIWAHAQTCLAQESWRVIKALDLLGMHDIAEGGLNYWIFAEKHGSNPSFCDNDGYLIYDNAYDMRHTLGHGNILETAACHCRLTENKPWFTEAAPVLKKACEWTIRQRKYWNSQVPQGSWFYGLLPPLSTGDFSTEGQVFYISSLTYYAGLKAAAEVLAADGVEGAAEMLKEVESWREDLRAVGDRSAALSRIVQADDGTYRRYIPFMPYLRAPAWDANTGLNPNWLESNFSSLRFAKEGIYGANEPIVQEMLDVVEAHQSKLNAYDGANPIPTALGPTLATLATEEDWFNTGSNGGRAPGQGGYESHAGLYLVSDVPLFLRAMYNTYAVEIMPAKGYIFSECPFGKYASDKTFEEAAFLERVRMMLVMEEGDSLWVARATPRAWLKQGQKIGVRNSPTFFGTLAYEIVSDVDHGRTTATVQMPSRNAPKSVLLRLRHPKALPIKSVEVNGKPWTDFDKDKEYIRLHGLTGAVAVRASY